MALVQAGVIVLMVLAQLFTFDDFLNIFLSMYISGDAGTYLVASGLVAAEVFSLPFLLRLKVSDALRIFSMILLWLVTAMWLALSIFLPIKEPGLSSTGLLGGLADISASQLFFFGIVFSMLTVLNSWGNWPIAEKKGIFKQWKR